MHPSAAGNRAGPSRPIPRSTDASDRSVDPRQPSARKRPRPRYGLRRLLLSSGLVAALPVLFLSMSLVGALRTPGNEDFQAKWADWMRNHDASWLVNRMERHYYNGQAPPVGGRPKGLTTVRPPSGSVKSRPAPTPGRLPAPTPGHLPAPMPGRLPAPMPVHLIVPGLPGEGTWRPTGPLVDGRPVMYVAEARPDAIHTSVLTTLVWLDPTALRLRLVPGAREPGGTWQQPPDIEGSALQSIVAAFNGGFRSKDSHGGFYAEHHASPPLRNGAASLVIGRSGTVDIGQWGRDVRMTPNTESVLQNLVLLIDHDRPVPGIDAGKSDQWGATLGNKVYVWRSAVGVDASGGILYAAGQGLRASTLADVLARAGAIRAMTLDINPEWVTFNFFDHPDPRHPGVVQGRKLIDAMKRPASRYLSKESRDFITVSTS